MPKTDTRGRPTPTDSHVGSQIRIRRLTLGLSQTKLAEAVGVTFQQVQKYERGTNRVSAGRMQQIAKVLDVPVSFFFEDAPEAATSGRKSTRKTGTEPDYVAVFLGSREGYVIMKAFHQITDRKLRHSLVALARQLAESDDHSR